jgi:hypothetical protein
MIQPGVVFFETSGNESPGEKKEDRDARRYHQPLNRD